MTGEWREVTIGDLCPFAYGKGLPEGQRNSNGRVPVYGSNGIVGFHDEPLTDGPTVVIGRKGTVGAVHYSPVPCWPIDTTFYVTGAESSLVRYRYYVLKSLGLKHMNADSAVPGLNRDAAHARHILIPQDEGEQRAIAHILGTLDDKIELNRRMSETLEQMARALFKAWFVDFEPVRAKLDGRWRRGQSLPGLPAHLYDLFPDRLVPSELGEIPEGWGVKELGEFIDTVKGRSYKSEELVESDTALVTLKSFARGGGYRPNGLKPFAGTYKAEQVVNPGEVVIACTDVTQAAEVIGRPAIVRGTSSYRRLVASLDTLIARPRDSRMNRSFLYFLCGTEAFMAHTYAHTTGTTVLHLAKEAVPSFKFLYPSKQLVETFDALAAPALERTQAVEEESRTLAALRDALLPKLITGELRVKDAERFLKEKGP